MGTVPGGSSADNSGAGKRYLYPGTPQQNACAPHRTAPHRTERNRTAPHRHRKQRREVSFERNFNSPLSSRRPHSYRNPLSTFWLPQEPTRRQQQQQQDRAARSIVFFFSAWFRLGERRRMRLVKDRMPAWTVKTGRDSSRQCRDARVGLKVIRLRPCMILSNHPFPPPPARSLWSSHAGHA